MQDQSDKAAWANIREEIWRGRADAEINAAWKAFRQMVRDGKSYEELNAAISAKMPQGWLKPDDPADRLIAGLPISPDDPVLHEPQNACDQEEEEEEEADCSPESAETHPGESSDPDELALDPNWSASKSTAQLYEEGAFKTPGARQYGYAAKIGVLPGFIEGDPEAWRLVMEGRSEWDPDKE